MTCTACGAGVRDGAKFCSECGAPTARQCPGCANPVLATDKFCAECGTPLQGPSEPPAPGRQAAAATEQPRERRFISALFIDIVGFTPLTEQRDSEEVREMLTRYFDRAREVVERFGGVIDKYIGDAVMAVWGAQVAREDDAERAVRAALELVDAVAELGEREGMPGLQARAGVLSGEAAVGGDGNATTGLIIGDTVNTASRLQSAADPGTVLVGKSTRDLASDAIQFEAIGTLDLKGKAEPVEAFSAVRVVSGHGGARKGDGLVPPFVGRTDEVRLLKDNLHAVERDGRLRLVSIVGQGGIGKSRLVDEFWNYVDGLNDTYYWHHGRSPSYGEGLSFWAIGEMVRQRCGIAEGDDDHRTRTRLRTTLAEYVPDGDDRAWMEPRFESLLGLSGEAISDRSELFAAWRMLFNRIADQGTTVLIFEDLHWADEGLLDFIDEMVSISGDSPILIVTLARPELLDRRQGWGSGRTNSLGTHLAPLAPGTMRDLVLGVVTDAPEQLVDRLVEHSGGVPLYAVELLRMLLARGAIELERPGVYRLTADVDDVPIPDSLHGLVGARIDEMSPEERMLIADAAILGQSFMVDGLVALRGGSTEDLTQQLEPLVRREVLSVNRDPRSPERGQYRFVQSIIREVAHQRISRADRFERHVKVAQYFDSLDLPEFAGVVASHYLDALEVAPEGEAHSEVRRLTIDSLLAAADRAAALQSHSQVLSLCTRGIEMAVSASERGELLIRAARAAHAALDSSAESLGRDAVVAFEEAGDDLGRMRAATALAKHLDDIGRSNEAWPVLLEAVEAAPGDTVDHAIAMAELGRGLMLDRRDADGLVWCDRALVIAEPSEAIPTIAEAWITKGAGLSNSYRNLEAMVLLEAGVDLAREHQLSTTKRRGLTNLAFVGSSDMTAEDDRLERERLEDARRLGNPRLLAEALLSMANIRINQLDWQGCDTLLAEVDPDSLSRELRWEYDETVGYRRMLCGYAPEETEANERRWEEQGEADSQIELSRELTRARDAYLLGRFEQSFDKAIELDHHAPASFDLSWATAAALCLHRQGDFEQILAKLDARPYRGKVIDLLRKAGQAGLAALEGRTSEAAPLFEEAFELADLAWGPIYGNLIKVGAARMLGLDNPVGRRGACEAHDAWAEAGVTTLLDLHADYLVAPDESGEAASA